MSPMGYLLLAGIVGLPIAWLVSEFRGSQITRITLGVLSIGLVGVFIWALSSILTRFNYNVWYGKATGELLSTSIHGIEDGHLDRVVMVWRSLEQQYKPTYENRAHYTDLVEAAAQRIRGDAPIHPGSVWDASVFRSDTWLGHWDDDEGYWYVINDVRHPFDIVRSGYPTTEMSDVTVSTDFSVLKFKEGDQWAHTVTLKNKYVATHQWFSLKDGTLWKSDTMYKLIRPTNAQGPTNSPSAK